MYAVKDEQKASQAYLECLSATLSKALRPRMWKHMGEHEKVLAERGIDPNASIYRQE